MAAAALPTVKDLLGLLSTLLGKPVRVVPGPAPAKTRAVAAFANAAGVVRYLALMDLPFVLSVGAGHAMMPAAGIMSSLAKNEAPDTLVENAYEVLNIASALFNEIEGGDHVKLVDFHLEQDLPPPLKATVAKNSGRLDLNVSVPSYPDGKLSLLRV